jgi:hypothetical protein
MCFRHNETIIANTAGTDRIRPGNRGKNTGGVRRRGRIDIVRIVYSMCGNDFSLVTDEIV